MGLGNLVADITGLGGYSGSSLKGFLSKFNSSEGNYINTIDPLNTFDVSMAFYPMLTGSGKKKNKLLQAVAGATKNLLNNVTGGILGSIMNDVDIMKLRTDFISDKNSYGNTTVLDYISRGNLLATDDSGTSASSFFGGASESVMSPQLILDISYYVQGMQLPQISMPEGGSADTLIGSYTTNGSFVKPSQNTFLMTIINTKAPLMERVFYPWMREVTLPYWSYENQPYTTATITVNFAKHTDMKYVFVGCRPSNVETLQPSNELGTPTRNVTILFDYMFIKSDLKTNEDIKSKLVGLGTSALNDLGSAFGL